MRHVLDSLLLRVFIWEHMEELSSGSYGHQLPVMSQDQCQARSRRCHFPVLPENRKPSKLQFYEHLHYSLLLLMWKNNKAKQKASKKGKEKIAYLHIRAALLFCKLDF